jgi:3-hydroxybutyryl-CoA dehydrogenase
VIYYEIIINKKIEVRSMEGKIQKVAVVGMGTLGVQIALIAGHYGYAVKAFDPDERSFERVLKLIQSRMANAARKTLPPFENLESSASKVQRCTKMEEAAADADLVIEAVPERLDLKRKIFQDLDRLTPRKAILATNSSSIPVSRIESATTRPEKCLNIHFYSPDLGRNIVDIMGGSRTSPETMEAGKKWIRSVGCVPLPVKKELLGFCFNRIWRAIKRESLHMWAGGYVDFKDIDRGYMIWNGVSQGPFALMDQVGLDVVYGIEMVYYEESKDPKDHPPEALKKMIERNELGVKTGKGFYTYPNPEYKDPLFLKGTEA